ncbi:MAG: Crp/Fnr family transcriptional regulator [Pseudomonadota bacterium]
MVTQHLIFVSEGVAASIQTTPDGKQHIARFFERGQLCSNLTSAWHQDASSDALIAMSDFEGVQIPFAMFRDAFMSDGLLSRYWREMVLETLLFDKDLISIKTMRDVEPRYRFLVDRYDHVVRTVPDKYIARFLGITPQGLSRFRKNFRPT